MYKSKLQELCHGKQWGLPRYTVMKHGADHNPCFNASVRVHGFSFDSPTTCASSKQAQNQAAMLAFFHFTSPPSTSIFSDSSILSTIGPYFDVPKNEELDKCFIQPEDYASVKVAPFKDTISTDQHTFFNTLKGTTEHAPAKAVSMSWSQDGSQNNVETIHYKNLLQELVQREGFCIPAYKTVISGASHMPTFSSTVEVEGQDFRGIAGKSKKLAELNAAKVAYIALKERAMSRASELTSQHLIQAAPKTTQSSDFKVTDNSLKNHTLKDRFVPSPATKDEQCAQDIKGTSDNFSSHEELQIGDMNETEKSSAYSESILLSTEERSSCTALTQPNPAAASIISDTNAEKSTGVKSYLLYNRVRVYTQYPDIASPNSMTVVPIGDDKWVPFCLEFPNEENN